MPKEKQKDDKELDVQVELEEIVDDSVLPDLPNSLNEELSEKIKDNPNKFIGCGG